MVWQWKAKPKIQRSQLSTNVPLVCDILRHKGFIVTIVAISVYKAKTDEQRVWRFPQQPRETQSSQPLAMSFPHHGPWDWVSEHWCQIPNKVVSTEFYASPQDPATSSKPFAGAFGEMQPLVGMSKTNLTVSTVQNSKTMFGHTFIGLFHTCHQLPTITHRHNMTTVDKPTSWIMQMHDDYSDKSNAL